MLDEYWQGVFGVGIRLKRRWDDEERVCSGDVAEVVASAHSTSEEDEEWNGWCKGIFRLKDGRFAYVFSNQCETCGSGGTCVHVRADLPTLLRLDMTSDDRETLGVSL
jgi:hypothetical protein